MKKIFTILLSLLSLTTIAQPWAINPPGTYSTTTEIRVGKVRVKPDSTPISSSADDQILRLDLTTQEVKRSPAVIYSGTYEEGNVPVYDGSTFTPQPKDSISVATSFPDRGNVVIRSDLDNSFWYKGSTSTWYKVSILDSIVPATPGTLVDISFPTHTGLSETSDVWTGLTGSGGDYTNYGLSDNYLASGDDGYIEFQYVATDGQDAIIAFNTSNTSQGYSPSNYEAGFWISSSGGTIFRIDNGSISSTGVSGIIGNYYRIDRTGTALVLQTSSDHSTWSAPIYTYSFSSSADLFINTNIDSGKKLYYPKGFNLQ